MTTWFWLAVVRSHSSTFARKSETVGQRGGHAAPPGPFSSHHMLGDLAAGQPAPRVSEIGGQDLGADLSSSKIRVIRSAFAGTYFNLLSRSCQNYVAGVSMNVNIGESLEEFAILPWKARRRHIFDYEPPSEGSHIPRFEVHLKRVVC